jgi:hypothetical protein
VASDDLAREIMRAQNRTIPAILFATEREHAVGDATVSYNLPGVDSIPLETILALRADEEAFAKWRRGYAVAVETAAGKSNDEFEFFREFKESSEETLRPLADEVKKKLTATKTLKDLVVPGAIACGLMAYTYCLTGELPLSSQLVIPSVTATWIGKRWADRREASKSGGTLLKEVCGYFLPKE